MSTAVELYAEVATFLDTLPSAPRIVRYIDPKLSYRPVRGNDGTPLGPRTNWFLVVSYVAAQVDDGNVADVFSCDCEVRMMHQLLGDDTQKYRDDDYLGGEMLVDQEELFAVSNWRTLPAVSQVERRPDLSEAVNRINNTILYSVRTTVRLRPT